MQDHASVVAAPETLAVQVDELSTLYRLTDRLYRAQDLGEVYDAALDAILQSQHCDRASILLFDSGGVMRFVAWRGLSDRYRSALQGHTPWQPGETDPQPIFVTDIDETGEADWVKQTILREGIRSLGFIPILSGGQVIGKFMTYFAERHVFRAREIELAVTIARQIGFSVERMRATEGRLRAERDLRISEERFRHMLEDAPVMIWRCDTQGRCVHLNRKLRCFWGLGENDVDFDYTTTIHPEDRPRVLAAMSDAIARHESVTVRARYRNACGSYRVLETDSSPSYSADGTFEGMIGVNVDVTDRERIEERFRLGLEAAPNGMIMTDAEGHIVLLNLQSEKLFGYERDELLGQPIERLVPDRFRSAHVEFRGKFHAEPTARKMGAGREVHAVCKDGTQLPVEIGLSVIETSEGPMVLASVVDISERKHAEKLRELLLRELNHRVNNTLAVVQAIANQTFRRSSDASAANEAFNGRLAALAATHKLLTQSSWQSTDLLELVDNLIGAHVNEERIRIDGGHVLLPPRQSLAISLALHELFTNAIKHGSLSNETGIISLSWARDLRRGGELRLEWAEQGGPPVAPPRRRGFGSRLIEGSLAAELKAEATLEFSLAGLRCLIKVPVSE